MCLIRFAAPPAMLWSASASGFGRGVFMVLYAAFLPKNFRIAAGYTEVKIIVLL
jgi:hypothetical protein